MTEKEKAKAYDEALKYGRYLIDTRCKEGSDGSFHRLDLDKMFPELAESEDEKIRKELIKETKGSEVRLFETVTNDEFVAWLEKQEQKQEWSLQDEKNLDDIFCAIRLDNALSNEKQDRLICWLQQYRPYIHKDQKPVEWSGDDDNMLEAILHTLGKIVRYKNFDGAVISSCENAANWLKSLKQRIGE